MAQIIDCKSIFDRLKQNLANEIAEFSKYHRPPALDVILTGEDVASTIYVQKKQEACAKVGIKSRLFIGGEKYFSNKEQLLDLLNHLNNSKYTDGILIQLPLAEPYKEYQQQILNSINVLKDVDVFHPYNIGLLIQGSPRFVPCTPQGIQLILKEANLPIRGKHTLIINRSLVVGQPLSSMLIQNNGDFANSTVTVAHDNTPADELKKMCLIADVIIVAVGIPGFLKEDMVKEGVIVIDVGITRLSVGGKVVGDVDPGVHNKASYVTVTPGGTGIATIYSLLNNTFQAAKLRAKL